MNIKRISVISLTALALVAQAMPASAATKTTLIRFTPSISATLDQGVITLTPPESNSPAKFRIEITNPAVAKADGLKVTLLGVGNTEIFYVQDAVSGFSAGKRRSSIFIRPGTPKLGAWPDQTVEMTAGSFKLTPPTSSSSGGWTYSTSDNEVISINQDLVTILDGGVAEITATQFPTSSWLGTSIKKKLKVNALVPIVSSISDVTLNSDGITNFEIKNPTSTSTGPWTFSSSNPAVVSVLGGKFSAVSAGVVTITAKQARTSNYQSYTTTFKVTVVPKVPVTSVGGFTSATVTLKNSPVEITRLAPLSDSRGTWVITSSDPSILRINGFKDGNIISMTALKAGKVEVTASQEAWGNYAKSEPVKISITVKGSPTVVAPANIERVSGDPTVQLPNPRSDSNGVWSFSSNNTAVASISGNQLTIGSAGSALITAVQASTEIWESATVSFEVRVTGITPTLGVAKEVVVAAGAKLPTSALPTSNSSGKWVFTTDNPEIANVVNGEIVGVAAGSTKISAYQEPAGKFGRSNIVSILVTVSGVAPKPTATPAPSATAAPTTPVATKATAGASLSERTITIIAKNAKLSELKITINGATAKLGANVVKPGKQTVVVSVLGKPIYTKVFDVK